MKKNRFLLLAGLMVIAMLAAACGGGPSGVQPDESGELIIIQIDDSGGMRFEPGEIVLTVGQRVRIILENQGSKDHEFMVGQNVIRTEDGAANGFEVDFFKGIADLVEVELGEGAMLMIDAEMIGMDMEEGMDMEDGEEMEHDMSAMGDDETMDMDEDEDDEHGMGHLGWMVMNAAGSGITIIEFTVTADMVGEWEMGCFEDDGAHYDDGMRGTLIVVEA